MMKENRVFKNVKRISVLVVFVLLGVKESNAQLKIYYMRHAEGGHNVKKEWSLYSNIPEAEWPVYVGDPNIFTPKGKMQQLRAVNKLRKYHFDFIAVSPMWRTRNTVLPYLKRKKVTGEIWPELKELYQSTLIVSPDLELPTVKILGEGRAVSLPEEEEAYFTIRKDGLTEFKLPKFPRDHSENEAESAASKVVIQRVLEMIQERFGGTDTSILLVGHGSSGKGVLRLLTKDELRGFPNITNTGVWMVEEQDGGDFKIKIFNDVTIEE